MAAKHRHFIRFGWFTPTPEPTLSPSDVRARRNQPAKLLVLLAVLTSGICVAQLRPSSSVGHGSARSGKLIRIEGGAIIDEDAVRTARETVSHSLDTPVWTNPPGFERDVFTFTRVIFQSQRASGRRSEFSRQLGWWVDYPDCDLNLSYRLQSLTTIRTDPDARVLKLTDPALFDYPLLYLEHAGYMQLDDDEVAAFRRYLAGGGAALVNDFWGTREWQGFAEQIERVLPGRSWIDLTMDHPVFHCVYELRGPLHRLRVPTMQFWNENFDPADPESPPHQVFRGEGSEQIHIRALLDEAGRVMILAIHNSDVSDGWEREGESNQYFNQFSEKIAYPLGINILFYLMTH